MSTPKSSSTKEDLYSTSEMHGASTNAQEENEFIRLHGFAEYGKWYLGINDEKPEDTKGCGLLSAESRAGQYKHYDIESAAHHLHRLMDGRKAGSAPKRSRAASAGRTARGHSAR
jgi:hypothetical protein